MATRLYMTARSPGTALLGPPLGDWSAGDSDRDNRGQNHWTFLLAQTATDGGVVPATNGANAGNTASATPGQLVPVANISGNVRWVSDRISGSTVLDGTLDFILRVVDPNYSLSSATYYHVYAYISTGDTLTERTVLINDVTDATQWTDTATWRQFSASITGTASDGDRIVLEVGAAASPPTSPAGPSSFYVAWGTTNSSDVVQADATNGSTTALLAAWCELSATVTFQAAPSPPANDACADATVIPADLSALGGYTDTLDSTTSTDTDRSVWWTWTPSADQRVFAVATGSNYYLRLDAYTGGCGSFSTVAFSTLIPWVGTSQNTVWFDAVSGTQYWFQVSSNRTTSGSNALFGAKNGGGFTSFRLFTYTAPQTDDLFVDCQHIVCFRDGEPILWLKDFYGSTPTGNAIDTTGRSMNSLNGGTVTADRLYVCLFGSSPLIEILDLATLNVGESEIDYISDPLNAAGHSENLSSVIFDQSGNILLGFYGNNYSVIDVIADVPTGDVMQMNAIDADNQSGAPFPAATSYGVAYQNGGSDFATLAADQDTVFYTSGGDAVKRYGLVAGQLSDFATLPAATGPRPGARTLRLLPPGDGTGGALVAYGNIVYRLDASGTVIDSYVPAETDLAQDLDKIELDSTAENFWVSDQYSAYLFKFNLASGLQVDTLATNLPPGQLCGFVIYGGYRSGDICEAIAITVQPLSQTIDEGNTATLTVTATGTDPIGYQWYRGESGDMSDPVGTNSNSYTTDPLTETTSFWVQVSNICSGGSTEFSATAVITVTPTPPTPGPPAATTLQIRWLRQSPTISSDGKRIFHRRFQLDCLVGNGLQTGAAEDVNPAIECQTSDDGGATWSNVREMFTGRVGAYLTQAKLYQLGAAYNRVYRVYGNSATAFCIVQAWLDLDGADH